MVSRTNNNSGSVHKPLSDAERRVVHLIAEGHTDKSAAKDLGILVNTVGSHIRSAYGRGCS